MRITIGIPCFADVPGEVLEDYMRFAYHLGRRYTEHEFFLAIKRKSEQFRAKNAIIEAALEVGSDFVMNLDDDQVIDWQGSNSATDSYEFLRKLLVHFGDRTSVGIVGALYYQRGGDCLPVLMTGRDNAYRFLRDDEVLNKLQTVDVVGGGAMLIDCKVFDKIESPWFQAESEAKYGTDIQICRKVKASGFEVLADTSVVLGHISHKRTVISPKNRYRILTENTILYQDMANPASRRLASYRTDIEEYVGMSMEAMEPISIDYYENMANINKFQEKRDYYSSLPIGQLARQLYFHHKQPIIEWDEFMLSAVNHAHQWKILDYGCGSAPATFSFLKKGHKVDFVDVPGSPAYDFLKWRVKKHGLEAHAGYEFNGPYDFVIFADSLEHLENWREVLSLAIDSLTDEGAIITNYFLNDDYDNPEHVSMDQEAVKEFLRSSGLYPYNNLVWVRTSPIRKELAA
jgi:2-polyprenyl-3-methyl-5-hydroxy-6-metoxy-1,4-benzoquinol methylase